MVTQPFCQGALDESAPLERNLHTSNFELLIFAKIKSIQGFCFGIEVVKNSEGACVFCTVLIWGAKLPPITAIQNTEAHSEFLTTSIPKQKP